jgi:ribosomal protein S18 acetylase RimI-like enzyme
MVAIRIDSATPTDADRVVDTIVQAFRTDPAARWMFRDERQYLAKFPEFIKAFAGVAFAHGNAHYTADYSAAALWLPPGIHPDEMALVTLLEETLPEAGQAEVFALFEQMERHHPDEPHWYLPMIGVDPAKQRSGYGSALLRYGLELCDGQNKLAYLEASSRQSVRLYERHGFTVIGSMQIGSSPPLFPMLRRPRPFAASVTDGSGNEAVGLVG